MECFICRQTGHIASNCKNPQIIEEEVSQTITQPSADEIQNENIILKPRTNETAALKRAISETLTSSDQTSLTEFDAVVSPIEDNSTPISQKISTENTPNRKRAKKKRKIDLPVDHALSEPTKNAITKAYQEHIGTFHLQYENLVAFLENSYGTSTPHIEAAKFTDDIKSLLHDLHVIYSYVERATKNRITRISKKIRGKLKDEEMEVGSLNSLNTITDDEDFSDNSSQPSQN
ncbi:hypothetical protein WA026_004231 [Henosepilachna vigintioctopunctata]|uniref:CCHC-type domain-containing protein n=1 Tax=Henosepilachna vigintioctopunctata TaxID=420089 RepID=A0AAW1V0U4_9CUCU